MAALLLIGALVVGSAGFGFTAGLVVVMARVAKTLDEFAAELCALGAEFERRGLAEDCAADRSDNHDDYRGADLDNGGCWYPFDGGGDRQPGADHGDRHWTAGGDSDHPADAPLTPVAAAYLAARARQVV